MAYGGSGQAYPIAYPSERNAMERVRRYANGNVRDSLDEATAEIADAALVGYPATVTVAGTRGGTAVCPTMPDMSMYVRKDSIPCWGCNLK